jgi:hypothetical protein
MYSGKIAVPPGGGGIVINKENISIDITFKDIDCEIFFDNDTPE